MPENNARPDAPEADILLRRKQVAANLLAGLNYRDMAAALGVSIGTIASDVRAILDQWHVETVQNTTDWIAVELRRLDRMINAIWSAATNGEGASIDRVLRLMERRARLLGLDEPVKLELSRLTDNELVQSIKTRLGVVGGAVEGGGTEGDSPQPPDSPDTADPAI